APPLFCLIRCRCAYWWVRPLEEGRMPVECPDVDTLRSFLDGRLADGPECDRLEGHLCQCADCLRVAGSEAPGGWLSGLAGHDGGLSVKDQPVVEELLRRAGAVYAAASHATGFDVLADLRRRFGPLGTGGRGRIGPYRLMAVLGAGGMGVVLRAVD